MRTVRIVMWVSAVGVLARPVFAGTAHSLTITVDELSAKDAPVFESRGILKSGDGQPIDVTWCAAPFLADLDGDLDKSNFVRFHEAFGP